METVLIIGAEGLLGGAIAERFRASARVLKTTQHPETFGEPSLRLDLAEDLSAWRPPEPVNVAFICAAATSLEECRKNPEATEFVNVKQTLALARMLAGGGAFVVFPSSNLVFDGSKPFRLATDPVSPRTVYGRQKAQVEEQLPALGRQAAVIRFTKVWGPRAALLQKWAADLRTGIPIHPYADMTLAPVGIEFAAEAFYQVATRRLAGISQVSGARDVTYAQVAELLAKRLGAEAALVQPVSGAGAVSGDTIPIAAQSGHVPGNAQYTTLDMSRLQAACGLQPPELEAVCAALGWK
jgi:dTDP-4-dehydrorhamnose reductase